MDGLYTAEPAICAGVIRLFYALITVAINLTMCCPRVVCTRLAMHNDHMTPQTRKGFIANHTTEAHLLAHEGVVLVTNVKRHSHR